MVFSFFKKKEKQPEEKMPERPAARPKAPVPPPSASQPPSVSTAPAESPKLDLPDLDFAPAAPQSSVPVAKAHSPVPTGASAPDAVPGQLPLPDPDFTVSEFERNFTESSVMAIDVDHDLDPVQADVEQVAVLFANGQDAAVKSLLDVFVRTHQGKDVRRFWAMYFDFLQLTGDRSTFDLMGLMFAENCETSPPAWAPEKVLSVVVPQETAVFELQGVLTADASAVLAPVLATVQRKVPVQLLCARLLGCDDGFAGQLLALIQRARTFSVPLSLEGSERLLSNLRSRMAVGDARELSTWRLGFELLQLRGEQADFEELAVDFAVTFEQSPPSWVAEAVPDAKPQAPALAKDACYLSGEIRSCKFDELKAVFEKHRLPVLDFSGVRRMDFFSAGQLANRLGIFKHGGREIVIRSPNHLVAELMGVVGINKYARILVPKS